MGIKTKKKCNPEQKKKIKEVWKMQWDRTKRQSKETVKEREEQRETGQWERDEDRQSSCISSCHLPGSDQCLIITSTATACWDSPACPLSPSSSHHLSPPFLHPSPSWIPPPFLPRWHNPSYSGATSRNVIRRQVAVRNFVYVREVKCELGWEWNPQRSKKQYVCTCSHHIQCNANPIHF